MIDFNNNNFINLCYNYDKEYKISKSDYIFDFPDVYKNYKVIIIDNSFDFIPINFFRKKQFTTDFMEYLVSLSLNEFDIKYFFTIWKHLNIRSKKLNKKNSEF